MAKIIVNNPRQVINGGAKKYYFKVKGLGGPKGDKGDKGDTGATGPQGPQGDPCTVVVNSTATLEPGSNAYVTNTGSLSNAVLDFGIPKGDRGPQGAKGDKGDTGAKGDTGPRGPQGERGTNATVSIGTTSTLNPGSQATVYNSGTDSNAVLNFGIPQGPRGPQGVKGDTGPMPTIAQTTGQAIDQVMSQKATTDALNTKQDALTAGAGIDITGGVISTPAIVPEVVAELPATGTEGKLYLTLKDGAKTIATGDSLSITTASGKDVLVAPAAILGEVEQDTTVSPTPDNPQAISYVTGSQTVTIQGKNLICPESRYDSDSHITVDYNSDSGEIHLSGTPALGWSYLTAQNKSCSIPAGTYRLTTDSRSNLYRKTVRFFHEGGSYTVASIQIGNTAATVTLTKTAIAYYIAVVYQGYYQAFELDDTFKLQLAAGSKSTEIEPYHNESISLPLGNINLRRVGDYADRIANINNAWVVERNTAIGTLTGIEVWYPVGRDYFTQFLLGGRPTSELQIISSKLLGLPRDDISGNNYITMSDDGNIRVNIAGIKSSEALASLLESNNIDYCYGLLAPEYEAIEDTTLLERLELLEALHIDKGGTTTISVSATGVTGELQVTYCEVEPDDKYDEWIHIDGGYERIDADNGLVPTDGGYIIEGETNSSNAIWSQWSNRLAFGMDTATAPVPAQFNGQIFVDGTIIAHNTGNESHNRWGFHVLEAYAKDNCSRMTMLLNKHDNEFDGKKSFEAYYYTGDSHKNSAYGFFKVGSDVKYHSFLFDRDKMIASGEIDCRFPVTLARINPSTDLDSTYQTVEAADTAYEPESSATENLKCLKYLALKNAEDGCMWYDTARNKVVVKINGEWHDMDTTPVPSGTYNF